MSGEDRQPGWWTCALRQLRNLDQPPPGDEAAGRYGTVINGYGRALWTRVNGAREAAAWRAAGEADPARKADEARRRDARAGILTEIDAALMDLSRGPGGAGPGATDIFSRILAAELRYFHVTDEADRFAAAQAARERFTRVASASALAARNASQVPELKIPLSAPAVADTIALLNMIHARYLLDIARETEVARQEGILLFRLQRPVMILGALFALTVLGALLFRFAEAAVRSTGRSLVPDPLFATQVPYFLVGLLLVVLFGYAGSVISVAQRAKQATRVPVLEGDPVSTIGGLAAGWNGVLLAMASASIFSGIAYLLFASGIANLLGISGGLFPVPWSASECGGTGPDAVRPIAGEFRSGPAVERLAHVMGFCGGHDFMKMLVIAFVAGFSERLVPDILQQIAARTSPRPPGRPTEVDSEALVAEPANGASTKDKRDAQLPTEGAPDAPAPPEAPTDAPTPPDGQPDDPAVPAEGPAEPGPSNGTPPGEPVRSPGSP